MGRRSRYESHVEPHLKDIKEWYQWLTERQIAERLGINPSTFQKYKNGHEELREALMNGKEALIEDLKMTMKRKAKGFRYTEKKTEVLTDADGNVTSIKETTFERYAPPDTGAMHLLLKNLDETWRNDDAETMKLKKDRLELDRQRHEDANW